MKLLRKINNNAAVAQDNRGREMVVPCLDDLQPEGVAAGLEACAIGLHQALFHTPAGSLLAVDGFRADTRF